MTLQLMKKIASTFLIVFMVNPFSAHTQELYDGNFADYLFREGEYYRAVTEYYRQLHAVSDPAVRTAILRKVGLCYFKGEDYDGYLSFYKNS